ncbi:MAG TPA: cytochrome c3 family protein [Acidobacteriota bacterium]|nr:cytochrome c3 family protein [Acidobacteriota bacterium]
MRKTIFGRHYPVWGWAGLAAVLLLMFLVQPQAYRGLASVVHAAEQEAAEGAQSEAQGDGAAEESHQDSSCITCHDVFKETPIGDMVEPFLKGVHARAGLGCESCHGGDPSTSDKELSMSPDRGYKGVPARGDMPQFCGSCHSSAEYMRRFDPSLRIDQVAEYRTSVHGQKLAEGDANVATCISCHGVHGMLPASNPLASVHPANVADTCATCHADAELMAQYDLPADQPQLFKASVHGAAIYERNDFGAATCNDCHGNHGATPPGVESVAHVCGNCHGVQGELFSESSHEDIFQMFEMSACVTCHSNHEIAKPGEFMLAGEDSPCLQCHEDGDVGMEAAHAMAADISRLAAHVQEARDLLTRAEQAGMEVSSAQFDLHSAHEKVILARNLVHTIVPERVKETVAEGTAIAQSAEQSGNEAFEELRYRRTGLFVALFVIALAIVGLWMWIRRADEQLEESRQSA